jgi:hypothetical protein
MSTHQEIPCKDRHPPESRPREGVPYVEGECRLCWLMVNNEQYKALWNGLPIPPKPEELRPVSIRTDRIQSSIKIVENKKEGPGTELKVLLASLGLTAGGCQCDAHAQKMNNWGTEGCKEHKEEILSWLRAEQKKRGWRDFLLAGRNALLTGLVTKVKILDPAPGLLEEAIRRAEAHEAVRITEKTQNSAREEEKRVSEERERAEEKERVSKELEERVRNGSKPVVLEHRIVDPITIPSKPPRTAPNAPGSSKAGEGSVNPSNTLPEGRSVFGSLAWAYGMTTVPSRRKDLLPRTLRSLSATGFPTPILFVDGISHKEAGVWEEELGLEVVNRTKVLRTAGNWVLSLQELYQRSPMADRYAIFQDDFIASKGIREYLERCPYPEKGYLNLYTFPSNESIAPKEGRKVREGWFESNQCGKGAVALVFDNAAVLALLTSEHLALRPKDEGRGHKAIDGGIVTSLAKANIREWCHYPSLVQHTGARSAMGNRPHPSSKSFRGEDYNVLEILG